MRSVGRPARLSVPQILDAVEAIGIDRFTVKGVADHLGVRDSTVYNYIDSREQLRADASARALARVRLRFDEVASWVDYLIEVNRGLRDEASRLPGLADYYLHGPYAHESLSVFDTQIAEVRRRLPHADDSYAFVLASHATTTTLSFFIAPGMEEDAAARVLAETLPALHRALGGHAPAGVDWPALRASLATQAPRRAGAHPLQSRRPPSDAAPRVTPPGPVPE